jgi:hypothetical protein
MSRAISLSSPFHQLRPADVEMDRLGFAPIDPVHGAIYVGH